MSETYIIFKPIASICERGKLTLLKELEQVDYVDRLRKHLDVLNYPLHMQEQVGLVYASQTTCRRCSAELIDYESVHTGIGPKCIGYWGLKEEARRFKAMDDGQRFGELRHLLAQPELEAHDIRAAYLILGYMEQDEVRHTARHYMHQCLEHIRHNPSLQKSA